MRLCSPSQIHSDELSMNYRPTQFCNEDGVRIGMASAISGAAVNPNMGYHSSVAVSFLLTVFNIRLGWWLGNPASDRYREVSPALGLLYTFKELFGMTNAKSSFVNLSDGGHFDNMGIYELVRRRCPFIICCDAEEDDEMKFEGIGNAIRKCRTDFGVEIELPLAQLQRSNGFSQTHCAVGTISYPPESPSQQAPLKHASDRVDNRAQAESGQRSKGIVVYMKSSLTGDEPSDILEYQGRNKSFPHQSTLNQWFDESQFESYRRLGLHVATKTFASVQKELLVSLDSVDGRTSLFESLSQIWRPATPAMEKHSGEHSDLYGTLMELVRNEPNFEHLGDVLFESWHRSEDWDHRTNMLCAAMIQFIERVYYDLGFEDPEAQTHPYASGWINIFRHWARQSKFQKTWASTRSSYPELFKRFFEALTTETTIIATQSAPGQRERDDTD